MTPPLLDPRNGDIEDDASSPRRHSLLGLAGTLLAEISLPKLVLTWLLLVGLPGLLLGAAPLIVTLWATTVSSHAADILDDAWPGLVLLALGALTWLGGRPLLRLAESSFWSLNALAVQPLYVMFREGLRHLSERLLARGGTEDRRARMRAATAAVSGVAMGALGLGVAAAVWPASRWVGTMADLGTPLRLLPVLLANGSVMIFGYCAGAAVVWGIADATMAQPRGFVDFVPPPAGCRAWRVAHLSDIHTVAEPYGFRIESGRGGPRGNDRVLATLARLDALHEARPLDAILITGDLTDAGRSGEWAAFFAALASFPALAALVIGLPGNHDVNVVDRASPARMDLPNSPTKRLRVLRMLSALDRLQGTRLRIVPRSGGPRGDPMGATLGAFLAPHAAGIAGFADTGAARHWRPLSGLWDAAFPMVLPPANADGLGIIVLNSNAATHFSFTNALGLVSGEQARAMRRVTDHYGSACWIVALHHHLVEYPQRAKALSERIGTALINGSWFVRQMQGLAGRAVVMHGHRHIDWIGACGGVPIVSAPSPVMAAAGGGETCFHVHTLFIGADGRLHLAPPERVGVAAA